MNVIQQIIKLLLPFYQPPKPVLPPITPPSPAEQEFSDAREGAKTSPTTISHTWRW